MHAQPIWKEMRVSRLISLQVFHHCLFVGRFLFITKFLSLMWIYLDYLVFHGSVLVICVFQGVFPFHQNGQIH